MMKRDSLLTEEIIRREFIWAMHNVGIGTVSNLEKLTHYRQEFNPMEDCFVGCFIVYDKFVQFGFEKDNLASSLDNFSTKYLHPSARIMKDAFDPNWR